MKAKAFYMGFILTYCVMNPIDYKEAQKNASLRQVFLDEFFKRHRGKGVSKLIYDRNGNAFRNYLDRLKEKGHIAESNYESIVESSKEHEGKGIDLLAFCPRGSIGRRIDSPIFVTPACFKLSEEDFRSVVVDHEYIHANHAKEGIELREGLEVSYLNQEFFSQEVLLLLDEAIAYANMIRKAIEKRDLTRQMKENVEALRQIHKKLQDIEKFASATEEAAVKEQIKADLNLPVFREERT